MGRGLLGPRAPPAHMWGFGRDRPVADGDLLCSRFAPRFSSRAPASPPYPHPKPTRPLRLGGLARRGGLRSPPPWSWGSGAGRWSRGSRHVRMPYGRRSAGSRCGSNAGAGPPSSRGGGGQRWVLITPPPSAISPSPCWQSRETSSPLHHRLVKKLRKTSERRGPGRSRFLTVAKQKIPETRRYSRSGPSQHPGAPHLSRPLRPAGPGESPAASPQPGCFFFCACYSKVHVTRRGVGNGAGVVG